jgi:hypothetical protein
MSNLLKPIITALALILATVIPASVATSPAMAKTNEAQAAQITSAQAPLYKLLKGTAATELLRDDINFGTALSCAIAKVAATECGVKQAGYLRFTGSTGFRVPFTNQQIRTTRSGVLEIPSVSTNTQEVVNAINIKFGTKLVVHKKTIISPERIAIPVGALSLHTNKVASPFARAIAEQLVAVAQDAALVNQLHGGKENIGARGTAGGTVNKLKGMFGR